MSHKKEQIIVVFRAGVDAKKVIAEYFGISILGETGSNVLVKVPSGSEAFWVKTFKARSDVSLAAPVVLHGKPKPTRPRVRRIR